jgi:putative acetyltransferase
MQNIIIRAEELKDRAKVFEVNRRAFGQDNESRLVDFLRTSNHFVPELSIVAEKDGNVIGHILFTKIRIVNPATRQSLPL